MTTKITPAMKRVLNAIHTGARWNAYNETCQAIIDAGLAVSVEWEGWRLTDAGRKAIGV